MQWILIIALGVWVYNLGNRVAKLERERHITRQQSPEVPVSSAENMPGSVAAPAAPQMPAVQNAQQPQGVPPVADAPYTNQPDWTDSFSAWLKEDFMVKLGAFLLLIAFGWFVSYAFANNWIGPSGRITLGLLAGVLFMVLGAWRIRTRVHQGGIFTALGSTTILLTVYAARTLYDMFTPATALAIMTLSVVFVAFVSVRYYSRNLALAGLILGSIAPLFTAAPAPDVVGLFVYLMVVVFGTLWIVLRRGWSILTFTAFMVVFVYGLPYLMGHIASGDRDIALLFAFIFTAIFFAANIVGLVFNERESTREAHIAVGLGTGLYLILWISAAALPEWRSLLFAAWMIVFSVGTYVVYRATQNRVPFYIYGATSVALLAAATASELSGPVLTIALTIEVALLVLLVASVLRNVRAAGWSSLLFLGPAMLSVPSIIASEWRYSVLHDHLFVLVILGLSLATAGAYLYRLAHEAREEEQMNIGIALIVAGAAYGLILIWLILHALLAHDFGTMVALVVYTLIGLATYIRGQVTENRPLRLFGAFVLGGVIMRLLVVEVWLMALAGRIITFFVIGALLVSTAFIGRHRKTVGQSEASDNANTP